MKIYWAIACLSFCVYAVFLIRDQSTPNTDKWSWLVAAIAASLWPVVLPVSFFRELLPRWLSQSQTNQSRRRAANLGLGDTRLGEEPHHPDRC